VAAAPAVSARAALLIPPLGEGVLVAVTGSLCDAARTSVDCCEGALITSSITATRTAAGIQNRNVRRPAHV
jgi:hypothetical protein